LNRTHLTDAARRIKPKFLYDPRREIEIYRSVLAPQDLGTPTYYGSVADDKAGYYWLFLERVAGLELRLIGDFDVWKQAARWLAMLHARFCDDAIKLPQTAPLLSYDADFYRLWMRRALTFHGSPDSALPTDNHISIEWISRRYDQVAEFLAALPVTLLHGEFYASNILVEESGASRRKPAHLRD